MQISESIRFFFDTKSFEYLNNDIDITKKEKLEINKEILLYLERGGLPGITFIREKSCETKK